MSLIYIVGLAGILFLFLWKKYTSHTKRRYQYIKYLEEQNRKLESLIQEPQPIQSMSVPTDSYSKSENTSENQTDSHPDMSEEIEIETVVKAEFPPDIAMMLKGLTGSLNESIKGGAEVEDVTEEFVDVRDIQDESDVEIVDDTKQENSEDRSITDYICEVPEFETEEDPEKVPLSSLNPKTNDECKDNGKCEIKPILEENFADVPEELFDRPSITVSQNDDSGVKAANTDDNRMYLERDEYLEESLDDLIQTKQMHCTAILKSGDNKGKICGKKSKRNGLCKVHSK